MEDLTEEEFDKLARFEGDRFEDAREIFEACALREDFPTFLTVQAYNRYLREAKALEKVSA